MELALVVAVFFVYTFGVLFYGLWAIDNRWQRNDEECAAKIKSDAAQAAAKYDRCMRTRYGDSYHASHTQSESQ